MATVVSIHRVAEKDGPAVALEAASFVADFGLEGDWRSRRGRSRQITLIEEEGVADAAASLGMPAVPAGASRRQVVVRGVALDAAIGKRLRVGPLLLDVFDRCDPCENLERKIGPGARRALEGRGGICARVLEGGVLRPGDPVGVEE
jgi:MOSC domain-containing protein YiiM